MRPTDKNVEKIIDRWRGYLGIDGRWHISVKIYEDHEADEWPHEDALAAVRPSPGYFQASLHLHARRCEEDADTLEHTVLHELVHIVLWPLSVLARDGIGEDHETTWRNTMEAAVEQITRALLRKKAK